MSPLIEKTESFVFNLLKSQLDQTFLYHNLTHTERVLRSLREIIEHSNINNADAEMLQLAALLCFPFVLLSNSFVY